MEISGFAAFLCAREAIFVCTFHRPAPGALPRSRELDFGPSRGNISTLAGLAQFFGGFLGLLFTVLGRGGVEMRTHYFYAVFFILLAIVDDFACFSFFAQGWGGGSAMMKSGCAIAAFLIKYAVEARYLAGLRNIFSPEHSPEQPPTLLGGF